MQRHLPGGGRLDNRAIMPIPGPAGRRTYTHMVVIINALTARRLLNFTYQFKLRESYFLRLIIRFGDEGLFLKTKSQPAI